MVAWVEGEGHALCRGDPQVAGGQGVQGTTQCLRGPAGRQEGAGDLTGGMDPAIGAAGSGDFDRKAFTQPPQQRRKLTLHRALVALDLPAVKISAFVVQDELHSPIARVLLRWSHGWQITGSDLSMSSKADALALAIRKLARRDDLTSEETEAAFTVVMQGEASEIQKSALLMGLRGKGETPEEVAGGVRALRRAMVGVKVPDPDATVDTCGTGGGTLTTFNISTAAAFVLAGAGVPVAKHGNRSFSSRCGSADVLEALGVNLPLTPQRMEEVMASVGLSFLYAPRLHPAMKHVGAVRQELAVPTIMNILGPLTNPAGARRQVVGVSEPKLLALVAGALAELGHIKALVVHGEPGLDELSPLGVTRAIHVESGSCEEYNFEPSRLGWDDLEASDLAGADPDDNARIIESVLSGGGPPGARAAVALNAAGGFLVADRVDGLEAGVALAESVLDDGSGLDVLARLRAATKAGA